MTPEQASESLRAAILRRPDLRFRERGEHLEDVTFPNPYVGYCYIATEAFCALILEAVPYCAEGRQHFWAMVRDEVWDLTVDQFPNGYDHTGGRRTRFKPRLSRSAAELVDEACA